MDDPLARYHRQMLLPGLGEAGQRRLGDGHALIVGCGALGTVIADALVRAGVGTLTIVDRDTVELTNLQRQVLFTEQDVARTMPKAEAARARLAQINSQVAVHAHVDDFNPTNAERYAEGATILMDGLDNFETRYLMNDLAVKRRVPYVYAGAVATGGMSMPILPHDGPCLRCVFPEPPPPGSHPTCDTAGVLGSAVMIIAAHQAAQAIKLLTGNLDAVDRSLYSIDVWANTTRRFDMRGARHADCPCCGQGCFEYLAGECGSSATPLCGRNAVQITPAGRAAEADLDLACLAERLAAHGEFRHNGYLLHGRLDEDGGPLELTVFPDGRAIIKGTTHPETARSVYARYVGN